MGHRSNISRHSSTNMLDGILPSQTDSPLNVCYLLDTSGSMYLAHDLVRKHLVDHLMARAHAERLRRAHILNQGRLLDHARQFEHVQMHHSSQTPVFKYSRFNIIAFTDSSEPWADNVVDLTPENAALASQWVKQMLRVKTGPSHIFQTLLVALHDPNVDQIVLITDAAPADFNFKSDFSRIAIAAKGRPVHTVLIETPSSSTHTFKVHPDCEMFAEKITHVTGAVFRKLSVDVTGRFFDEVQLIKEKKYDEDWSFSLPNSAGRPFSDEAETILAFDGHCPAIPIWRSNHFKALKMPEVPSLDAASLLLGREVLCRRNKDGFYYLATVSEYVSGSPRFLVTFRASNSETPEIEEVFLDKIVNLYDCLRNPIGKGDKVLASASGKKEGPYSTGIVMDGSDARRGFPCNDYQKVSVAFSTGDVKSLCSDVVVKVPDRFHGKSSHEEGVPPVQRRALQLAEEAIQREKKPDICSGYPVQPALNYATSCYPCSRMYYLPVCSGYGSKVQRCLLSEKVHGIGRGLTDFVPDYPSQEILLTRHKPSFVRAEELNQNEEKELIPQPFIRGDNQGWCLYQQEPCTNRCRISSKSLVDKLDSDNDDEFDEFLTDVRTWGDRRDAATDTDLSLLYPERGYKLEKRPPWRYWKQKKYEKPPSEQPAYHGDKVIYAPARSISITDTSGISGCSRNYVHYEPDGDLEHSGEEHEIGIDEGNDHMTSDANGKSVSFVEPLAEALVNKCDGKQDLVVETLDSEVQKSSSKNREMIWENEESAKNENFSGEQGGKLMVLPSEEQVRKDQVRGRWAEETNRYFDDIRDNLRLQHSRQRRALNQRR